jgi:predicted alpha-1,6-mannanase (GH76 family)
MAGAGTGGGDAAAAGTGGGPAPEPERPDFDPGPVELPSLPALAGDDWHARDDAALAALARMYAPSTGKFTSGPRWSYANDVFAAAGSFARTGGANHLELLEATFDLNAAGKFVDDLGYDDQAWWGLAWVRAFDVTGDRRYLDAAKYVFQDMTTAWTTSPCGGGVWWNRNRDYKNAITNELFIQLAAALHNHTAEGGGVGTYLDWAQRSWAWFAASGLINANGLVNDGLTARADGKCVNNGQTTWTYNQGVILGALVELFDATGDPKLLIQANVIADAVSARLVDGAGVLREPCAASGCDGDQVSFKGIFIRNLARLWDVGRAARHHDFLLKNARAVWARARGAGDVFGTDWSGPFDAASATRQASAMFALGALAEVISPASPFLRPAGSPTFTHPLGHRDGVLGWACDAATCPTPGLVLGGPFLESLPRGAHELRVRARVDRTSAAATPLVAIQVVSAASPTPLGERTVAWSELAAAGATQTFAVPFTTATAEPLELRVRWLAAPGAPALVVEDLAVDGEESVTGANLGHECGRLDGSWHWTADRFGDPSPCFLTRGGAVTLPAGDWAGHFELRIDAPGVDDDRLATLSVYDRARRADVGTLDVRRGAFRTAGFQLFAVPFHADVAGRFELRARWLAAATAPRLRLRGVHVRRAAVETPVALPFNVRALGTGPGDGAADAVGSALDLTRVTAALGGAGATFDHFTLGGAGKNGLAGGAPEIAVAAGRYRSLAVLGFAVGGNQVDQPFTLLYADGTSQVVTRSFSDWISPAPLPEERIHLALPYRWSRTAKEYGNFHLFRYDVPVDPTRPLRAIRTPAPASVVLLAATLTAASR